MTENGKIYKYTNNINGKIYIGQTKQDLEHRHKKHLSQLNNNTYFHRAVKKYGIENFTMELIEDNIPFNQLNDRERYWIDKLDSFYTLGKGYNLTQGGQWGSSSQILSIRQSDEIKQLIKTTKLTFEEIGKKYGVTLYAISDINRGKSFYDNSLTYPLRKAPEKSELNEDKINIIIDLLANSTLSIDSIALIVDIKPYTAGEINRGKNSWCPRDIDYPIRKGIKKSTYQNILTQEDVIKIVWELIYGN